MRVVVEFKLIFILSEKRQPSYKSDADRQMETDKVTTVNAC